MPSSRHRAITKGRNLKFRSPGPVEGQARNHGYQGLLSDSRLGPQMGGFKQNFYRVKVP